MNKKELASKVADVLRLNDIRKPVKIKKHSFKITDEEGHIASFSVKPKDKMILYSVDDVLNIIDACLAVIIDAMKNGEEVAIRGFGSLGLHYRAARRAKQPGTDEWCEIDAHYTPKFFVGNDLKDAAKLYDINCKTRQNDISLYPDFDNEDEDGDV